MIRRPPRSTLSSSSAASDVYKRQGPRFWPAGAGVLIASSGKRFHEKGVDVTTSVVNPLDDVVAARGVYAPQHDSKLLCAVMAQTGLIPGRHVADLCTGSGVVAIQAALLGAASV